MRRERKDVTDTELAVLRLLWDEGPSTIRRLTDRLYPRGSTAHYATVQKLLERLEAKRCARRRQQGRVNVYSAAVDREQLIAHRLRETADKLCGGSLTPLLTQLVSSKPLSREEIAALRELVGELERSDDESRGGDG